MVVFVQFSTGLQAGKTGQKYDKININTGFCLLRNYENHFHLLLFLATNGNKIPNQNSYDKYLAIMIVPCRKCVVWVRNTFIPRLIFVKQCLRFAHRRVKISILHFKVFFYRFRIDSFFQKS